MSDKRLREIERNYELLRAEVLVVKRQSLEWKQSADHVDALRENELATMRQEVEHLRIENQRLRDQLDRYTSKPTPREGMHALEPEA